MPKSSGSAVGGLASILATLYLPGCPQVTPPTETPDATHPAAESPQPGLGPRPESPTLASPLTAVDAGTVELRWNAVPGAEAYALYVGTDADPPALFNLATTSYSFPDAIACRTYYWKVEAINAGVASQSPVWSFQTNCPAALPQRPNYPAPTDEAIDVLESPELRWAAAPNATAYEVYLGTTTNPPYLTRTDATSIKTPQNLRRGGRYYWRVVAKNENGDATSRIWSFEVATNPAAPRTPLAVHPPANAQQVANSLRFAWRQSDSALGYELYLDTSPQPQTLVARTGAGEGEFVVQNLATDATYYWKVIALGNPSSTAGPTYSFHTAPQLLPPGAPDFGTPPDGAPAAVTDVVLTWRRVPNADSYEVYIGETPDFTLAGTTTEARFQPAADFPAGTFIFWRVVAINAQGRTPGPVWSFRTGGTDSEGNPGAPPGSQPPAGGGGGGIILGSGAGGGEGDDPGPTDACDSMVALASRTSGGNASGGLIGPPSVSASGRLIAFASSSASIVAGDQNGATDVFVHDRATGQTTRVSVTSTGAEGAADSTRPSISADGRYVAFESDAALSPDDLNGFTDIYLHDRALATTTLVTPNSDGPSRNPEVAANGAAVAFYSLAQLAADDPGGEDIYMYLSLTGGLQRVSAGLPVGFNLFGDLAISNDSRRVAFSAAVGGGSNQPMVADTLLGTIEAVDDVGGDVQLSGNGEVLVYFRYFQIAAMALADGIRMNASSSASGVAANRFAWLPDVSGNGRYVTFVSPATNLGPDGDGALRLYRKDLQTGTIVAIPFVSSAAGLAGQSGLSGGGGVLAFVHNARLDGDDTNSAPDVYLLGCGPP